MKILVTGAFGNIGRYAVASMLEAGHRVRGLSENAAGDRRVARALAGVEVAEGDVRRLKDLEAAAAGCSAIVHLAYVIPPPCYEQPERARAVNVGGTANVIEAARREAERTGTPPRILFASTLDVYGHTSHLEPPRRVTDPVTPTDNYTGHKIEGERMVRESGLPWTILRFADVPPIALRDPHPIMFTIPLAQRIEMIHPRDAGLAVANAVARADLGGRVLNIGGGARCQLTYGEYLCAMMEAMGMGGPLPEDWFTTRPYCTDWLDTEESQRLLQYQRHDFRDVIRETSALLGWRAPFVRAARPLVRWQLGRLAKQAAASRQN